MLIYLRHGPAQKIVKAVTTDVEFTLCYSQSQSNDIGPTSPSTVPLTPGA